MDDPSRQRQFHQDLASLAGACPFQPSFGEVVLALSGAKPGSSGGTDHVVAEMLHALPWQAVTFLYGLFCARLRLASHADCEEDDAWREYLATWIRKDRESDLLSSFRPIVQSSVFTKWLERICLGPRPERALLPRFPLWGFRPGLAAAQLALTVQFAIHAALTFESRSASSGGNPCASQGQGDDPPFVLFIDVEKAFDKMLLEHQRRSLLQADLAPARVAAYLSEQLHSKVWARLGDVQSGPLAHSRGKQGGCGTPFSFNAMMTAALSKSFASWERRGFGI